MKIKTSDLSGIALDWVVAKCEGRDMYIDALGEICFNDDEFGEYSTDWSQGGPIIERESIALHRGVDDEWKAQHKTSKGCYYGPTPLIAAMRCYAASKMGDEADIPEDLV